MSEIFLRSVELSNFRVYGDRYAFEFPAEPSITLITGANGIGKTSFFDGIEWALTGQVSRFSDIKVDNRRRELDPLTRIGAPAGSHRVSVAFSNGDPIDRGNGYVPENAEIASLLKQQQWPNINSLHGYLSITHFLGQAATRRFSLREPKGQWEALKGPAGVDRINGLRERLAGQGARQAFTRAIRERTTTLEIASDRLADWHRLLDERNRYARLSLSELSSSPDVVIEEVGRLAIEALNLLPHEKLVRSKLPAKAEDVLSDLAALIAQIEERIARAGTSARTMESVVSEYEAMSTQRASALNLARECESRRANLTSELASYESHLASVLASRAEAERAAAQAAGRASALSKVELALSRLETSQVAVLDANTQLGSSRASLAAGQNRLTDGQRRLDEINRLLGNRARAQDDVFNAEKRAALSARLVQTRRDIDRLTAQLFELENLVGQSDPAGLAESRSEVLSEIDSLTKALQEHDDRSRTLAEAVAAIAHQLSHDDVQCPICASTFAPGRLRELANLQASSALPQVVPLARDLALARAKEVELNRQLAEANKLRLNYTQLQDSLTAERDRDAGFRQSLVEVGGSLDVTYDETTVSAARVVVAELDQRIALTGTKQTLEGLVADAVATVNAERIRQVTIERRVAALMSDIEAAKFELSQHSSLWSLEGGLLVSLPQQQAIIQLEAKTIGEALQEISAQAAAAQSNRDSTAALAAQAAASLAQANRQVEQSTSQCVRLQRRWSELGQLEDPNGPRLGEFRMRWAEIAAHLEGIKAAHVALQKGYRNWLDDQELQRCQRSIGIILVELEVEAESAATQRLAVAVERAKLALEGAQKAKSRMEEIGERMQERVEEFADDVLKPLNDTIQRFARTLMTWSDESIIYHAQHHRTRSELRPAIHKTFPSGLTTQVEMNPNLYFSEGQLSALSVSALLAASTTFSWSRWRALLLDDPLQHNDVIHASAFMDLLRLMVRELRYQVIISTHDSSEADLLIRKCQSAGIRYTIHELTQRGDDGLITAVA